MKRDCIVQIFKVSRPKKEAVHEYNFSQVNKLIRELFTTRLFEYYLLARSCNKHSLQIFVYIGTNAWVVCQRRSHSKLQARRGRLR